MGRKKKIVEPDLILSLDFGGSGLKCIYRELGESKPSVLFMEPEVTEIDIRSLTETVKTQFADPENAAWIGIESDYQAVGYLATAQYKAINRLKPKKHSLAVYRTLAAIWVLQQKLNLPSNITIALSVLLPPSELSDAKAMLSNVKKALNNYQTPTGTLNVLTSDLNCYPEGMGVYLHYASDSKEEIKNKVLLLVMMGYRNTSILISQKGLVTEVQSIDLGMIEFLEGVRKKTSGLEPKQIIKAIEKVKEEQKRGDFEITESDLIHLTENHLSIEARKEQAKQILNAINESKSEYMKRIKEWLVEKVPKEIDVIVYCGGTVDNFRQELDRLFPATPVRWHGNFKYPENLNEKWLGNRLVDSYGLFKFLEQQINKKYQKQIRVEA